MPANARGEAGVEGGGLRRLVGSRLHPVQGRPVDAVGAGNVDHEIAGTQARQCFAALMRETA